MATTFDEKIPFSKNNLEFYGLFKQGSTPARHVNPLIVLIHGTGTKPGYFDNKYTSVVKDFSNIGFDVLNLSRPGYGGTPLPTTKTPLADSVEPIIELIQKVYREKSGARGGIVLIGHSLGGALALSIAAHANKESLPLLGVSSLGCPPTQEKLDLWPEPDPEPDNPRFEVPQTAENIKRFMGDPDQLDLDALSPDVIEACFETSIKAEIKESNVPGHFEHFAQEVIPKISIPVQILAAESDLFWTNVEEGKSKLERFARYFTGTSDIEWKILEGGAHDFELSRAHPQLFDVRRKFVERLAAKGTSISVQDTAFKSVPILDYAQTRSPETLPAFLAALKEAIVNVGFFYLKNTGIPEDVQAKFVEQSIALFDLPLEKKLEIEMVNSKHFLGYARLGQEITALKNDYREQFDFATELPPPGPDEPLYRNLRGPNQWPDPKALPEFRSAIERYLDHIDVLASSFKGLVARALDLPPNAFDQFFDHPQQNKLKLIKYPKPTSPEQYQGVGPHKDSCFLTFLMQGTPHKGLEVQNKAGDWLPVNPIPGTLVINIGRALEAITHGVCTATTHRVRLDPENYVDENGKDLGPRYSFAVFQGVSLDLNADKISLDIPAHILDLVKDEKVRSDAEATFNEMFSGNIGEGTLIARITSHQDVAARWYPDLLEKALQAQKERYK